MKKFMLKLLDNKIKFNLLICSFLLLGFHVYQFIDSGFLVYPLIRIFGFSAIIVALLFLPDNFLAYVIFIFALAIGQTISFENYSAFIMVLISYFIIRKHKEFFFSCYFLDVLIVCTRHQKSAVHFVIHLMNCFVLYSFLSFLLNEKFKNKRLDLEPDEEKILNEIVFNGKKLKEIPGYKANTISIKLEKMRKRNFCASNKILYERFKIDHKNENQ